MEGTMVTLRWERVVLVHLMARKGMVSQKCDTSVMS